MSESHYKTKIYFIWRLSFNCSHGPHQGLYYSSNKWVRQLSSQLQTSNHLANFPPTISSTIQPNLAPSSPTMRLPTTAAGLLALAHLATCTTVTLHLPSTPAPGTLSPRTHATLTTLGRRLSAPLSAAHSFVFRNVSAGSYLADVHCPTDGFAPLRVDVVGGDGEEKKEEEEEAVQAWETYRGNDWGNKGEALVLKQGSDGTQGFEYVVPLDPDELTLELRSRGEMRAETDEQAVDEETRAEWEASQKENPMNSLLGGGGQQPGSALGNFDMAAYLAGSKKKESGGDGSSGGGGSSAAASTSAESKAKNQGVRR
ncbi:hypothetical protein BBAD15_g8343 [Beauveria bassiana D1-5]|uniref:ER membrane protein complex subunit 7 beta-sandwich domain-containing protein n=1 Tax=Beauveria bassiana D1-5 TaxID=1245745 RepID=A0A0A2VEQ2_BEABA|nr:hypothetical protein BBAD15_g8343 [Beauveria bassiana D1-5]